MDNYLALGWESEGLQDFSISSDCNEKQMAMFWSGEFKKQLYI